MKRIFTLLVSAFLFTMVMGQAPTALIKKATVAPKIDGLVDAVWATADKNAINVVMTVAGKAENPTIGNSWWKALWDEKGIYVLVFVEDNVYIPAYMGTTPASSWMYDKPEIYFDCNYVKKDGIGGGGGKGHYQFAPTEIKGFDTGGKDSVDVKGFEFSFDATAKPHYYAEYFFPFTELLDQNGIQVDKMESIGFDVNIMDNDILTPARDRMNWANAGVLNESYGNMDDAGLITLDGAVAPTMVDKITIVGGTITADNGTFQLVPVITPVDATVKIMKYTITGGTGKATISATGLVTGLLNGPVTVRAEATDGGMAASNEVTITISNQVLTIDKVNFVTDGHFKLGVGTTPSSAWSGGAVIVNGVAECTNPQVNAVNPKQWDWAMSQSVNVPFAERELNYIFSFKAWSDAVRTFTVDFEDVATGHNYPRYGTSSDATANATTSEWTFDLTTEPTVYVQHVTFPKMLVDAAQKINFQLGLATAKVYITDVVLATEANFILDAKDLKASSNLKVFPNPVGNGTSLFVDSSVKTNVAIYNAVGQKMMEKVSNGNRVEFNVSSLVKGMYIVKLSDGTTQKFIK